MITKRMLMIGAASAMPAMSMAADTPVIVTDIAPLAALALMIEPQANVSVLAQDADPHHITLRPSDLRALGDADLVIWMGGEFSHWMEDALSTTAGASPDLAVSDTAQHAWLDPGQAMEWTAQIATALGQSFPDNADAYQDAAATARDELAALQSEIAASLAPHGDLRLLTAHDAYGAFATRFGLTIVASISGSHDDQPSAAKLAKLTQMVRDGQVDCIFEDAGEHDEAAHMLAHEATVYEGVLDPLGNLNAQSGSYAELLRNLAAEINACAEAVASN